MRTNSKPINEKRNHIMSYLAKEGFLVARTGAGFVALDKDGITFLVSPHRTHAIVQNKVHGRFRESKIKGFATVEWFSNIIDQFLPWSKENKPVP